MRSIFVWVEELSQTALFVCFWQTPSWSHPKSLQLVYSHVQLLTRLKMSSTWTLPRKCMHKIFWSKLCYILNQQLLLSNPIGLRMLASTFNAIHRWMNYILTFLWPFFEMNWLFMHIVRRKADCLHRWIDLTLLGVCKCHIHFTQVVSRFMVN